jgi:hypothetical protein
VSQRTSEPLVGKWALHGLERTAAYRMAQDLDIPFTHVHDTLGHRYRSTTQIHLNPRHPRTAGDGVSLSGPSLVL